MINDDMLINRVRNYLKTQGKKAASFSVVQKSFPPGDDLAVCQGQQIFVGYVVGYFGDCSFKNVFEGANVFNLVTTTLPSLIYASSLTSAMGFYIVGYIVNWE